MTRLINTLGQALNGSRAFNHVCNHVWAYRGLLVVIALGTVALTHTFLP